MKIAVVSDDGGTVSEHFGRAPYYVVLMVEDGQVLTHEMRAKAGHRTFVGQETPGLDAGARHGYGPTSQAKHRTMAETIADCQALSAGGWAEEPSRACGPTASTPSLPTCATPAGRPSATPRVSCPTSLSGCIEAEARLPPGR